MRLDGEFYYSFNEWWRIRRDDFQIHMLEGGRWRHANEFELEQRNRNIYVDFMKLHKNLMQIHQMFRSESLVCRLRRVNRPRGVINVRVGVEREEWYSTPENV